MDSINTKGIRKNREKNFPLIHDTASWRRHNLEDDIKFWIHSGTKSGRQMFQ